MTVYGPDIETVLQKHSNEFNDVTVAERQPVIDLNAANELSGFRESWENTSTTASEHQLSTTADTNDSAFLETEERGQYVSGYEVQTGVGVRVPSTPTGDSVIRWGYYAVDSNGDPLDGFYFGVDADGVFIAVARNGDVSRTYQSDWNLDVADGSDIEQRNPSGVNLDVSSGHIFQIEFTYYGYGPVKFSYLANDIENDPPADSGFVDVHKETFEGQTSIENTNLPLRQGISSGGSSNDALDLFVGGRQFSIIGRYTTNNREAAHYRDSLTGVDDAQWYPAISISTKDGTDVGSVDFTNVITEALGFDVSNDQVPKRWQLRRGTTLNQASWESPSSVEGNDPETAIKVDTSATSIDDGSGNASGYFMDGGVITSGDTQRRQLTEASVTGKVTDGNIVTLAFRSQPGEGTGAVNAIHFRWEERW